jgi:hypothetical protein
VKKGSKLTIRLWDATSSGKVLLRLVTPRMRDNDEGRYTAVLQVKDGFVRWTVPWNVSVRRISIHKGHVWKHDLTPAWKLPSGKPDAETIRKYKEYRSSMEKYDEGLSIHIRDVYLKAKE